MSTTSLAPIVPESPYGCAHLGCPERLAQRGLCAEHAWAPSIGIIKRDMALDDLAEQFPRPMQAMVRGALTRVLADAGEYERTWERHKALCADEDTIVAHSEQPYPLDVHFKLDDIRRELGRLERYGDELERRLRGGAK